MTFKKGDVVELVSGDKFRDGSETRQVRRVSTSSNSDKDLVYFIGYSNDVFTYAYKLKLVKRVQPFKVGDVVKKISGESFINGDMTSVVKSIEEGEKIYFEGRDTYLYAERLELVDKPVKTIEEKLAQYDKEISAIRTEREGLFQKQDELDTKQAALNEKYAVLKAAQKIMEEES